MSDLRTQTIPTSPLAPQPEHVRSIPKDLILTLITVGMWNIYVQAVQMRAINAMIGQQKYAFWPWLGLSIITCGLYHIYHEYRKSVDIAIALKKQGENDAIICIVLCLFGLSIVADAIQQTEINRFYGVTSL